MNKKLKTKYRNLCLELERHNNLYYVRFKPEIDDSEYDKLYQKLVRLEKKYPELIKEYSPTQRVGSAMGKGSKFEKVKHASPMLSLSNVFSVRDIDAFQRRVRNLLEEQVGLSALQEYYDSNFTRKYIDYCLEPKYDGISIELIYKKGVFTQAITRGDGVIGDDITANVRTIKDIPMKLISKSVFEKMYPPLLIVRGEIYMSYSDFDALNEERALDDKALFMNPRNAAGGTLHLKDPKVVAKRKLKCFIYDIVEGETPYDKHNLNLGWLTRLGLPVYRGRNTLNLGSEKSIIKALEVWTNTRNNLNFPIDGLVLKLNYKPWQKVLGTNVKDPRWAVAYKFPADQAETQLLDVSYQVGRTGAITPVAELQPVVLAGSRIKRASLHNFSYIAEKGLKINDTVIIAKAGEIIPQVIEVKMHNVISRDVIIPVVCPVCGTKLLHKELASGTGGTKEKALRCPSIECPARMQRQLIHFVGRDSMNIDAVGEKFVIQLFDEGLICNFSDFYSLTKEDLLKLDRVGERKADKVLESVENSKKVELANFIFALGIPNVGVSGAKLLANYFGCAESLVSIIEKDREKQAYALNSIEGFGPVLVNEVLDYLYSNIINEEISALLECGIDPFFEDAVKEDLLGGKTFCITGTLSKSRKDVSKDIETYGGKVVSSVSAKLDYLISGEKSGSKYDKAQKLGVTILSESDFYNMI